MQSAVAFFVLWGEGYNSQYMSIAGNIWTSSCSNLTPADSPQMVMKECSSLDKEPAFMDRAMNRGTQGSIAG